jgi:hypothetical protein
VTKPDQIHEITSFQLGPATINKNDHVLAVWFSEFDGGDVFLIAYRPTGSPWKVVGRFRYHGTKNQAGSPSFDPFNDDDSRSFWTTTAAVEATEVDVEKMVEQVIAGLGRFGMRPAQRTPVGGGLSKLFDVLIRQPWAHMQFGRADPTVPPAKGKQ